MIYTCGHKNPDLDSIASAISMANLLNKRGENAKAARQGKITPEVKFVLDKFIQQEPELKTSFKKENIFLVDFSDIAQAPDDINEANIIGIVDHHKIGDITTSAPIECIVKPYGCANTVIKEIYDNEGIEISSGVAGIMLSAILSDTVLFKSPTCTEKDIKAAKELAKIAGIKNIMSFGMEMFNIKSAVKGCSENELIKRDYKPFDMHGKSVGIGQLEVVDLAIFNENKEKLKKELENIRIKENMHTVCLLLTDIIKEGSEVLVVSEDYNVFERAFDVKLENNSVWLDGCLSRKKQIIPFLEPEFA